MKAKHAATLLLLRFPLKYWFGTGPAMDTNKYRRAIKKPHRTNNAVEITTATGRNFVSRPNPY